MSFGVGLVLWTRAIEGRERQTGAIDADYFRKPLERYFEALGIVDLRHQADIGQRDLATTGVGTGRDQRFQRFKAGDYPMMVPGVDRALLLAHGVFQITQRAGIVQRVNIAGNQLGEPAHTGARDRVLWQKWGLRMRFVEIFDDGERLDQNVAALGDQDRYAHLRIDRAELRQFVVAAILDQMNRRRVVADALQIQRNAHAVGRRGAEKGIKFHRSLTLSLAPVCSIASATSCADRSVICCKARWNASRSPGVKISVRRRAKSSACGANSS